MIQLISGGAHPNVATYNSPMHRVLLVIDQFPATLGGGERVVLKLAELLPLYGYQASILTFAIHPKSSILHAAPCPIYLLPLQRTYNVSALRGAFALRNLIKNEKIEIVQTFFESSDLWAGFFTKTLSKARLVWSRRDMGILRSHKHQVAYRLMARFPDAVFAVSDQVRQHCIASDRIDPQRVFTVYNGLDLSRWSITPRQYIPMKDVNVTSVGNIRRVKGHDLFIRAAGRVIERHQNIHFTIAGAVLEPTYFSELQRLVRDLNLTNNFSFLGDCCDLPQHLASASIFVLPSRSEGFSNAIIEAMAASLPVIATRVGGNGEAVADGVSGLVVPPEDVDSLAIAIEELLDDPLKAYMMGAAGRKLVVERFTADAMMNAVTQRYSALLSKR